MPIIKPVTVEALKKTLFDITLSRTNKVTKVTDGSVLNAWFYAMAKNGQKAMKDIALSQAHMFPDDASGDQLDVVANLYGAATRLGSLGSSTYIRVVGSNGTLYQSGVQTVTSDSGIIFNLDEDVTIGEEGFAYIKVSSQTTGSNTNIQPFSIVSMQSAPVGHEYVTNEYQAIGGRDQEDDLAYNERIKNTSNIASMNTLKFLEAVMISINPNVLRIFSDGLDSNGRVQIKVLTQNGANLTTLEKEDIINEAENFMSMLDLNSNGNFAGSLIINDISFQPIDIGFRCELESGFNATDVRIQAQININKFIDYRLWQYGDKVNWDDLLGIVKSTSGIKYVNDEFFLPNEDILVDYGRLPRVRGFEMRDLTGVILDDGGTASLDPVYYPQTLEFAFNETLLSNL